MTTVLLVHAFPLDASMWDRQIAALGREVDVVAPSLPGFGGSSAAGDILTMDAAADTLVRELDRRSVERAVVCGVSMGGYVAFALWRHHRDRVAGLLLADTRAEPDDEEGRARRRAVAEAARARGSDAIAEAPPPLLAEGADPDLWAWVRSTIRRQPGEAIAAASLGMAERPDSRPLLPEIDVPVTVVMGSADTLTPPAAGRAMAEAIPDVELVILEGAGHLSNLEHPEGFTAALRSLVHRTN